jgi:uncharacterized protein
MQARIHVITLAVADLERTLEFYRSGLGLESPGVVGTEGAGDDTNPAGAVAMFQRHGGLILALYPRTELAKDANIPLGLPQAGEFSIGHAVTSKADVDAMLGRAEGGRHTGRPATRPSLDQRSGARAGVCASPADAGTERSMIWVLADLSARRWSGPQATGGVG